MRNEFNTWLSRNAAAGEAWKDRLLTLVAAGAATALVGLSVVLMAGVGRPAGEALQASVPSSGALPVQTVRRAEPLATVTITGRREQAGDASLPATGATAAVAERAASAEAPGGIALAGDNLRP